MNRVRYISDTSTMYEGTIRWGLDETTHGDAAGGGATGQAPGAEPSEEAKRRMTIVRWFEGHDRMVRLTARHFGFSPDTISRWANAYQKWGPGGLEKGSRRPKNVRQPQTPAAVVQRILALREERPAWGREKLRVLLLYEGICISAKSIDRVLKRLRARGVLREPALQRKAPKAHLKRLRRPHGLSVAQPGALVQMDSKQVRMTNGKTVFQFGAVDCFTRKRVVALAPRLTSQQGARFLHKVLAGFPFPVQAIQADGGSEFLGEFSRTVSELKLTHYFNRPNYPQGNGRIERSFRTDDDEFYHCPLISAG